MPQKLVNNLLRYHAFTIICGILILILCSIHIPQQDNIPVIPHFDKIVHFTMYFVLSFSFIIETIKSKPQSGMSIIWVYFAALFLSAVLGGMVEFIQGYLTDYRSADLMDWIFDLGGSFSACVLIGLARLSFR